MNNEVRNVPTTEHQRLKDLYQKMGELASVHASKLALHYYQMMVSLQIMVSLQMIVNKNITM